MEATARSVEYHSDARGRRPLSAWLKSLDDAKGHAAIMVRIDRIKHGNFGDHEPVGDGVLELKIDVGPGYRVYYGMGDSKTVVLLCGGTKRSQKRDIARAKRIWRDYT
jgi:putative addiction module killer protein